MDSGPAANSSAIDAAIGANESGADSAQSAISAAVQAFRAKAQAAQQQQQKLQQQQAADAKEEQVQYWQAINGGAQDYQPYLPPTAQHDATPAVEAKPAVTNPDGTVTPAVAARPAYPDSGLQQRSVPNPAVQGLDPRRVRTFPISGRQVYYPTAAEKAAAKAGPPKPTGPTDQQVTTDTLGVQREGGTPTPAPVSSPTPWAAQNPHVQVRPGGAGTQSYDLPTPDEASARTVATKTAEDAVGKIPIPDDMADKLHLPRGTMGTLANVLEAYKTAYPTAPQPHVISSTNNKGDVTTSAIDLTNGKKIWTNVQPGVGKAGKDPDAAPAAPKMTAALASKITRDQVTGFANAQKQFAKDMQEAVTPEDRQAARDTLLQSKQDVKDAYEQSIATAVGHPVDHYDFATGKITPATNNGQRPAATAAPGQVTKPVKTETAVQPAAGGRGAPAAPERRPVENDIIVNGQTKQRMIYKGGQWKPIPAGQ